MIGKVQDMVTSAIVIGAMDKASADSSAATSKNANAEVATANAFEEASAADYVRPGDVAQNAKNEQQEEEPKLDEETVSYMTEELNELMSKIDADLEFQYHKEVNTMSVRMLDKKTGKVLKEIPPEEMIKHMIKTRDWLGTFLDKKA